MENAGRRRHGMDRLPSPDGRPEAGAAADRRGRDRDELPQRGPAAGRAARRPRTRFRMLLAPARFAAEEPQPLAGAATDRLDFDGPEGPLAARACWRSSPCRSSDPAGARWSSSASPERHYSDDELDLCTEFAALATTAADEAADGDAAAPCAARSIPNRAPTGPRWSISCSAGARNAGRDPEAQAAVGDARVHRRLRPAGAGVGGRSSRAASPTSSATRSISARPSRGARRTNSWCCCPDARSARRARWASGSAPRCAEHPLPVADGLADGQRRRGADAAGRAHAAADAGARRQGAGQGASLRRQPGAGGRRQRSLERRDRRRSGATLVIGNKNYSSWSLRPWLLMRHFGVDFEEVRAAARHAGVFQQRIGALLADGRVPALHVGRRSRSGIRWRSAKSANERWLGGRGWPSDPRARAAARSAACEMHSGFGALRAQMPMDCRPPAARAALGRRGAIATSRGSSSCGAPARSASATARASCAANSASSTRCSRRCACVSAAMARRLSRNARGYMETIFALPAMREWLAAAEAEPPRAVAADEAALQLVARSSRPAPVRRRPRRCRRGVSELCQRQPSSRSMRDQPAVACAPARPRAPASSAPRHRGIGRHHVHVGAVARDRRRRASAGLRRPSGSDTSDRPG